MFTNYSIKIQGSVGCNTLKYVIYIQNTKYPLLVDGEITSSCANGQLFV